MHGANPKEIQMIGKSAGEFSRNVLAPAREETDKFPFGPFFQETVDQAFKLDFFHATLPESIGGIGLGIEALCTILDEICREDSSLGAILFTTRFAQEILLTAGLDDQLTRTPEDRGDLSDFLIAYPLLMNPAENRLLIQAQVKDGRDLLNGPLEYLVLGGLAAKALVPVKADGGGFTYYLIRLDDPHVIKSEPVFSHGMHACPAVDIQLKDAEGTLVGEVGRGALLFESARARLQIGAAAMACGLMKGALKESLDYCRQRMQGGRKIVDWSEMQIMLGEMAMNVQVAQMLVERACQAVGQQEKGWERAAAAATPHVTGMATRLVADAIQVMGGVGYMKDFGQEKRFRDAGHIHAFLGLVPLKKIEFLKQM